MKYINKEYGFTFRPPFFDKFYEEKNEGPDISEENFPARYMQGVGYDYSAVNGAMLVGKRGSIWGVKVSYYDGKKWLDNNDFIFNMAASCANTIDGSFAHFSSGAISVKWAKHNEQSLVAQISSKRKLRVRVVFYPCFNFDAELSIEGAYVKGRSPYVAIIPGNIGLTDTNAVFKDRYRVVLDDRSDREYFLAQAFNKPSDSANGAFNEAIMEFVINKHQPSIYLYATVGDEKIFTADVPRLDKVIKQIETAELRYGVNKTMGSGVLGAPVERMLNSVLWSRVYYPYLLTEIFSPKRATLNDHFDLNGVEENCAAILGCITGNDKAQQQLKYTVEDRIASVIAVWFIFAHATEKSDMLYLYKSLSKMYPPEASLVVADADKNEVAYRWSDSPLKETYNNLKMFSLDMSSLKLLAFDILERICLLFDLPERGKYGKAKRDMIQLINDTFWNPSVGLYVNRYTTGQWARNYGATSFYPLLAGAVDTEEKLSLLVNALTDPAKFWSDYLVPTLSIDNKEYGKRGKPNNNGHRNPPYFEYRGSIIPYVNYIIYHGLTRYGLDELAGIVAYKSAKLWTDNKSNNVVNYSMYLPNGHRYKSDEYLSSNGNMLALIGMEELIDLEYFRDDLKTESLRFGTFAPGNHALTNRKLLGRNLSVDVNDLSTMLVIDNVDVFKGEGGRFVVRNFLESKTGCSFMVDARSNITIHLNIPQPATKKTTKYFFIVPMGRSRVVAENGMVNITPIERVAEN